MVVLVVVVVVVVAVAAVAVLLVPSPFITPTPIRTSAPNPSSNPNPQLSTRTPALVRTPAPDPARLTCSKQSSAYVPLWVHGNRRKRGSFARRSATRYLDPSFSSSAITQSVTHGVAWCKGLECMRFRILPLPPSPLSPPPSRPLPPPHRHPPSFHAAHVPSRTGSPSSISSSPACS